MSTRDDYIRRLIMEAGQIWAQVVRLIKTQLFPEARERVERAYQQLLGLQVGAVETLAPHELIARLMLGELPAAGRDRCIVLITLLKAAGDIDAAEFKTDAGAESYHKALALLLITLTHNPNIALPDYAPTVADLAAALDGYALPLDTNLLLFQHYEQAGAYAKAEDVLFTMLDQSPGNAELVRMGQEFYTRLQAQSDERLVAGNLPRAEVMAGLAELLGD